MKNLFAYGTLMCGDIMYGASGYHLSCKHGTLRGYRRRKFADQDYPALMQDIEAAVDGLIYLYVSDSGWDLLDQFEGEMYERRSVSVELTDGTIAAAETYVTHPDYQNLLDKYDWDFDCFITNLKDRFKKKYIETI